MAKKWQYSGEEILTVSDTTEGAVIVSAGDVVETSDGVDLSGRPGWAQVKGNTKTAFAKESVQVDGRFVKAEDVPTEPDPVPASDPATDPAVNETPVSTTPAGPVSTDPTPTADTTSDPSPAPTA